MLSNTLRPRSRSTAAPSVFIAKSRSPAPKPIAVSASIKASGDATVNSTGNVTAFASSAATINRHGATTRANCPPAAIAPT